MKEVNILNCLYPAQAPSISVAFEIVRKDCLYCDLKTRKVRRKSQVTKNELMRAMLKTCQHNALRYRYVLSDNWFCSAEKLKNIKQELNKKFIMAIKANRTLAQGGRS